MSSDAPTEASRGFPHHQQGEEGSSEAGPRTAEGAAIPGLRPGHRPPGVGESEAQVVRVRRAGRSRRNRRWAVISAALAASALCAAIAAWWLSPRQEVASGSEAELRVGTPVLSARRVPGWASRPVAARNLNADLAPVMARLPASSCLRVDDPGTTVVSSNPDVPLVPASNLKLLTGAAALAVLGADTRLSTVVTAAAQPQPDGTLVGDLFLVGGGDPLLTTDTYRVDEAGVVRPETDLEALADRVVAAGVRRVAGSIVGDGSRYDDVRTAAGWPERYVTGGTVANLGALMVNDARTVDPVNPDGPGGGPAPDPAAHAADVLTRLLQARGVTVDGPARSGAGAPPGPALAEVQSLTVAELVAQMETYSDNTTAELLLKEIGLRSRGKGSTAEGAAAVTAWAASAGLPVQDTTMVDGSGLSPLNRMTCSLLVALLVRDGPDGPLSSTLARPGRPGTLDDLFLAPDLRDRLWAKTGTLNEVTALSGWTTGADRRPLAFALVENTGGAQVSGADLAAQEELVRVLGTYPRTPSLAQVLPREPVPG